MAVPRASGYNSAPTGFQVPRWDRDPVWSLKPWPVSITVGPVDVEIPAMSAADWLEIFMTRDFDLYDVLELVSYDVLVNADLSYEAMGVLAKEIISTVSARHWWIALRLIAVAESSWDVVGAQLIYRGIDATRMSLAAWLTVTLYTMLQQLDPKDVTMFVSRIEAPPPDEMAAQVEELEMSADAFLSLGD